MIVPFAAGGPTDIAARLLADLVSRGWGQTVVVENRPGGGSVIGSAAVARSLPDGYTLLFGPSSALIENSLLMRDLPYDPISGFASVAEIYRISAGLSINSKLPVTSVDQLVRLARSRPLTYSSFGIGTGPHLLLETFKHAAGIDVTHVPYKGNVPGLAAVVSGEVDMTGAGLGAVRPHVEAGALRLLAVAGEDALALRARGSYLQGAGLPQRERRLLVRRAMGSSRHAAGGGRQAQPGFRRRHGGRVVRPVPGSVRL